MICFLEIDRINEEELSMYFFYFLVLISCFANILISLVSVTCTGHVLYLLSQTEAAAVTFARRCTCHLFSFSCYASFDVNMAGKDIVSEVSFFDIACLLTESDID